MGLTTPKSASIVESTTSWSRSVRRVSRFSESAATRRNASTTTPPTGPTIPPIFASKTAATQSGLGWIGKTALLVTPQFGSSVRLGTVFTDAALPVGAPITIGRCGSCRACVDACPVGAGRDVTWRAGLPRSALYDRAACDAYQLGFPEYDEICGICIWVCPYTKRAFRRQSGAPHTVDHAIEKGGER